MLARQPMTRVLVAHFTPRPRAVRLTTARHLQAVTAVRGAEVLSYNAVHRLPSWLRRLRFDAVVLHTTFLCLRWNVWFEQLRPREQYARYHLSAVLAALGKPDEARPLLEGVVKEYPDFVEARVLLASVYYRLNRKGDGDRERAIVQKLNSEQQAKQPGAQKATDAPAPMKAP